jgi:glycosyltransferase involved in cell wall biosynthesis
VHAIPVGAVEDAPQAQNVGTNHRLRILFYGSFLPLHGVDTILEACTVLKEMPLDLEFIGTNEAIERKIEQQLGGATQLRYKARRWVDFSDILQSKLPNTDLCLGGPFGNTPQARRVITGKTSQALAQAVPTVVGKIDADIPFQHQVNCLYVSQGNAQALSDAIVWANQNRDKLVDLGLEGRKLYHEQLSLKIVSERLSDLLYQFSG